MECISLLSVNSGSNSQIILNEIKHITSDNLNLIKNYDEIILNFSYLDCYKQTEDLLKKVEDLDVICIINLKDKYKFCISPTNIKVCSVQNVQSYILDTSTNISKKISYNEEVLYNNLEAIYNNYLFFIKNKLDHIIFNKILSFVDMCLNINDNKYFILAINLLDHLHMKIQKTELSKDDMYEIFNHIKHLSDKFYYNKTCKIVLCEIINKLNNIEFADSLVSELLHISTINITMKKYRFYIKHLYDLLKIDKDIKKILDSQKIEDYSNQIKSRELYKSVLTRTDWVDELESGNIMGILLNVDPKDINKSAYNLDYIPIHGITHTIIGFDQMLEAYANLKDKDNNIGYYNVLSGFGVGEGNCILPIYINKEHWKFVKLYMYNNLGIIFNRNALDYSYNHKTIYKNVLINMINLTFSDGDYRSDKWINLLFSVLRTNYELFKNDKTIKQELNKFMEDVNFRTTCNLNTVMIEYLISNNTSPNLISYIFEELIRRTFKSLYNDISILDRVYDFDLNSALNYESDYDQFLNFSINNDRFTEWLNDLEGNKIFSEKITLIYGIIMMKKMISVNCFFDVFDENCGILPDDILDHLKEIINKEKIVALNSKLIGLVNPKFCEHSNFTKSKVFSINTFLDLGLVTSRSCLQNVFIQGLIQRVNKSRTKAIKNNRYQDPYKDNNIINFTGLLISHRYIKNCFILNENSNYISALNHLDINQIENFIKVMISKTITIKKYILENTKDINESILENVLEYLKD